MNERVSWQVLYNRTKHTLECFVYFSFLPKWSEWTEGKVVEKNLHKFLNFRKPWVLKVVGSAQYSLFMGMCTEHCTYWMPALHIMKVIQLRKSTGNLWILSDSIHQKVLTLDECDLCEWVLLWRPLNLNNLLSLCCYFACTFDSVILCMHWFFTL